MPIKLQWYLANSSLISIVDVLLLVGRRCVSFTIEFLTSQNHSYPFSLNVVPHMQVECNKYIIQVPRLLFVGQLSTHHFVFVSITNHCFSHKLIFLFRFATNRFSGVRILLAKVFCYKNEKKNVVVAFCFIRRISNCQYVASISVNHTGKTFHPPFRFDMTCANSSHCQIDISSWKKNLFIGDLSLTRTTTKHTQ